MIPVCDKLLGHIALPTKSYIGLDLALDLHDVKCFDPWPLALDRLDWIGKIISHKSHYIRCSKKVYPYDFHGYNDVK